jgi:hypothetical protein
MTLMEAPSHATGFIAMAETRPSLLYRPGRMVDLDGKPVPDHENGQLQFHSAPHVIRQMAPGNGFGKTASVAVEIDWWGHNDHPFLEDIPKRPRQMVWIAQKHGQWDLMRRNIERWWPASVVHSWVGNPVFRYTWPDGSTLSVITAETDWTSVQGIQPDLVVGDEEFPIALWREMLKRRRGSTRTKYCVTATATQGLTWTYTELYVPWLKYHDRLGMNESQAMRHQGHRFDNPELADLPGIWCWPMGSHRDNPTATKETWAFYLSTTTGSEAERHVRLYGGFRSFNGAAVFNADNLEAMRAGLTPGRTGAIVEMQ